MHFNVQVGYGRTTTVVSVRQQSGEGLIVELDKRRKWREALRRAAAELPTDLKVYADAMLDYAARGKRVVGTGGIILP